ARGIRSGNVETEWKRWRRVDSNAKPATDLECDNYTPESENRDASKWARTSSTRLMRRATGRHCQHHPQPLFVPPQPMLRRACLLLSSRFHAAVQRYGKRGQLPLARCAERHLSA